ncbi:MAG: shikimate kinase [Thermoflavifilum sp.]|nr:shikimate kinase [Thermoflavifilum sp.]
MRTRIFLWGFMGAGKTALGKALAEALQVPFYDLDAEIEAATQQSIAHLFATRGEAYFRKQETTILRSFQHEAAFVMACGGGTPCYDDNAEWMKQQGITLWINPPIEVLVKRLKPEKRHRPLIAQVPDEQLEQVVREKLIQRVPYYSKAHLMMQEETIDIPVLIKQLQRIANQLNIYNHHP